MPWFGPGLCVGAQTSASPCAHPGGAVHRLHAGVREIGSFVDGLDRLRDGDTDVALAARDGAGLGRRVGQEFRDPCGRQRTERAFVPLHDQCVAALQRSPVTVGQHGDALRNLHDLLHARNRFRRRVVDRHDLRARHRRVHHDGREQSGQLDVDAEARAAVDLGGRVDAREGPLPRMRKSFASLRVGFCGTGSFAAAATSSP